MSASSEQPLPKDVVPGLRCGSLNATFFGGKAFPTSRGRLAITLHRVPEINQRSLWPALLHAIGSPPVGVRAGFLACNQGCGIGQALGIDQMLESRKPMIIVMRTIVGFPATRGGVGLVGKRGCPFLPCEMPLLGELHRERERVGLLRLGKHRLALVSRQPRQRLERSNSL
jgi:hypothetical protein